VLELMMDRAQVQIVFHSLEGGLDLDELDIEPPQLRRLPPSDRRDFVIASVATIGASASLVVDARSENARTMRSKPFLTNVSDPRFQSHPEVVDRLESVLTKFYFAGEGPEWQAIWHQFGRSWERTTDTPVDRCQALAVVLQGVNG
jgi:hypothetical protein